MKRVDLKVSAAGKTLAMALLGTLFFSSPISFASGNHFTSTETYPTSHGSYRQANLKYMALGTHYVNRSVVCWDDSNDPYCPSGSSRSSALNDSLFVEGNVGIGTARPKGLLSVVGNAVAPSGTSCPPGYDWYDENGNGSKDGLECKITAFQVDRYARIAIGALDLVPNAKVYIYEKPSATTSPTIKFQQPVAGNSIQLDLLNNLGQYSIFTLNPYYTSVDPNKSVWSFIMNNRLLFFSGDSSGTSTSTTDFFGGANMTIKSSDPNHVTEAVLNVRGAVKIGAQWLATSLPACDDGTAWTKGVITFLSDRRFYFCDGRGWKKLKA